jgi:hypothetical protein
VARQLGQTTYLNTQRLSYPLLPITVQHSRSYNANRLGQLSRPRPYQCSVFKSFFTTRAETSRNQWLARSFAVSFLTMKAAGTVTHLRPSRAASGYIALHQYDRLFRQAYLKRASGYSDRMSHRFDFVGVRKTVRGTHVLVSEHQAPRLGRADSAG